MFFEAARRPARLAESRWSMTELGAEVPRLKSELVAALMDHDVLRKPLRNCQGTIIGYGLIRPLCLQYPLSLLCRLLEVFSSGYYALRTHRHSKCAKKNTRLEVIIQSAHVRIRRNYGPERLPFRPGSQYCI